MDAHNENLPCTFTHLHIVELWSKARRSSFVHLALEPAALDFVRHTDNGRLAAYDSVPDPENDRPTASIGHADRDVDHLPDRLFRVFRPLLEIQGLTLEIVRLAFVQFVKQFAEIRRPDHSASRVDQQKPQRHQNTPRILTVHGHAEPVSRFLFGHRLDTRRNSRHVIAISHRRKGTKQQAQVDREILVYRLPTDVVQRESREIDAMLLQDSQQAMFY